MLSRFKPWPLSLLFLATVAHGQVELVFKLGYSEALELETVPAVVTLANTSAQTLQRDKDYRLSFDIAGEEGMQVNLRKDQYPQLPAELPPETSVTFTNDLSFLYHLDRQGQYTVAARLQLANRTLVSGREFLDILPGSELLSAEGVAPDGTDRRYSLRQLSRNKQTRLYLRVDDPASSLCYGVIDLGRVVPLHPPVLRVDQNGLAHVLHMTAPTLFVHSVFSPAGDLVAQQTHSGDASAVRLEPDPESGFRVLGVGVSEPRDPFIDTLPSRKHL